MEPNMAIVFAEVVDILNNIEYEYKKNIPSDLLEMFEAECDRKYLNCLKENKIDLKNKKYSKKALTVIAYLNLKYWCKNSEEKKKYRDMYLKNITQD